MMETNAGATKFSAKDGFIFELSKYENGVWTHKGYATNKDCFLAFIENPLYKINRVDKNILDKRPNEKINEKINYLYKYIIDFYENNQYSPTVREIQEALCIKSSGTVHSYLKILQAKNLISVSKGVPRGIYLNKKKQEMKEMNYLARINNFNEPQKKPILAGNGKKFNLVSLIPGKSIGRGKNGMYKENVVGITILHENKNQQRVKIYIGNSILEEVVLELGDRIEISYGEELDTGRKVIYLSPNQGGYKLTHNNKNNSYNCHITTSLNYFNKQFISHLLKNDADGKRIMDHEVDGRNIIIYI